MPAVPGPTVLIVEDNLDNRTIYRTILEHFGYEVLEAGDGEAGVRMARERLPDLVLMDISIPLIDGHEATRMLKADPATARIPVIALTAHAMPEDRILAAEAGCDAYLAKPAEPRRVAAEVQRLIALARGE
jgi:CheY-like chemotaxis protein